MRRGVRLKFIRQKTVKGRRYLYFDRPGFARVRLPDLPENHPDFLRAYQAAADSAQPMASAREPRAGTLGALIASYKASASWRALAATTRDSRARILDKLRAKGGEAPLAGLREHHVHSDLKGLDANPYNLRLKVWRALMAHAVDERMIREGANPAARLKAKRVATEGHHTWTPAEIAQFRDAHPYGGKARLAFELALWTSARRSDLTRLGRQMIDGDGWLVFRQGKTGGEVSIPLTCALTGPAAALAEDHAHVLAALRGFMDGMLFLTTMRGTAHSSKAFGAWFRAHVTAAGLPQRCSLHGLRKARAARLGELGWSELQIGAWTGHASLSEIVRYTRKASKRRMIGGEQEQNVGKRVLEFSEKAEKSNGNKGA